jgi:hypothetical protein
MNTFEGPAGDHMRIEAQDDGTWTMIFDDKGTGRRCGGCTLCCKLLPNPALNKPANKQCHHARTGKGYAIYSRRPMGCQLWSCRWKSDPSTAGMPRPDRCHYVIDCQDDYITWQDAATGKQGKIGAFQIWVDPAFPDAHRAPELRAWMERMSAKYRCVYIIRYSASDGFVLAPPAVSGTGEWVEKESLLEREHAPGPVVGLGLTP